MGLRLSLRNPKTHTWAYKRGVRGWAGFIYPSGELFHKRRAICQVLEDGSAQRMSELFISLPNVHA